jgi:hypothetical protein
MDWGSNPCTSNRFLYSSRPTPGPTQCPIRGIPGPFFAEVKHPECQAELSPPSIAEVQNVRCTSTLPMCLYSVIGR